jgi:hypothetical protein
LDFSVLGSPGHNPTHEPTDNRVSLGEETWQERVLQIFNKSMLCSWKVRFFFIRMSKFS